MLGALSAAPMAAAPAFPILPVLQIGSMALALGSALFQEEEQDPILAQFPSDPVLRSGRTRSLPMTPRPATSGSSGQRYNLSPILGAGSTILDQIARMSTNQGLPFPGFFG